MRSRRNPKCQLSHNVPVPCQTEEPFIIGLMIQDFPSTKPSPLFVWQISFPKAMQPLLIINNFSLSIGIRLIIYLIEKRTSKSLIFDSTDTYTIPIRFSDHIAYSPFPFGRYAVILILYFLTKIFFTASARAFC